MSETLECTSLTVLPKSMLPTVLAADTDDILGKLAAKVSAFRADASTNAGRDEIRSMAAEVARTKSALEKIADGLTEGWRKSHLAVVAEKKVIKERLDALRDNVRAPLTAYENAEKERVAGHEAVIAWIIAQGQFDAEPSSDEVAARLQEIAFPERDWREFSGRARDAWDQTTDRLTRAQAIAEKREAEARELARLRAEEAERQRKAEQEAQRHREAELARKAAEAATAAAEQRAAAEKARMEREAQAEREAATRREREHQEALAKAERERVAAQERAEAQRKADAAAAEQRQAEAVAAERRRQEQAAAAERAEAERRAADKAHKAKINREALQDLAGAANLTTDQARAVVVAIASRRIRHVSVAY